MRICFLDDEPEVFPNQYGGKARTIVNLAREFSTREGVDRVSVVSRSIRTQAQEFTWEKIRFKRLEGYATMRQILDELGSSDVCSIHSCSFTMPYLSGLNTAVIYNLHDVAFATSDAGSHLDKALSNNWSAIVSPSEFASSVFSNLFWWSDLKDRLVTVPRGVDLSIFYRKEKTDALNAIRTINPELATKIAQSYPVLFFPHRLNANKGEELLMPVYDLLKKEYPETLILLTGNGNCTPLFSSIQHIPWIGTESMRDYLSLSSMCLVLSKSPEAFSQVPLESVACGTPVVAFRVGNLSALIDEFPAIKECKPEPRSICETICALLREKDETKKEIKESFEIVARKYNIKRVAGLLLQIYGSLSKNAKLDSPQISTEFSVPRRYFVSPRTAIYGNEIFLPDNGSIKKYNLDAVQSAIFDLCRTAIPEQLLHRTLGKTESIQKSLESLVNAGLVVRV